APVFLKERRDRSALDRGPGRGDPIGGPADANHVSGEVLRLPDQSLERLPEPGAVRDGALPGELRAGTAAAGRRSEIVRRLGVESVRASPVRDFFQDLYRKGVGDPDDRALGRLGGAADSWAQPRRSDPQRAPARGVARRRARDRENARGHIPLSANRRRADVGGGGLAPGGRRPSSALRGGG